jgi:hypothetical protein
MVRIAVAGASFPAGPLKVETVTLVPLIHRYWFINQVIGFAARRRHPGSRSG